MQIQTLYHAEFKKCISLIYSTKFNRWQFDIISSHKCWRGFVNQHIAYPYYVLSQLQHELEIEHSLRSRQVAIFNLFCKIFSEISENWFHSIEWNYHLFYVIGPVPPSPKNNTQAYAQNITTMFNSPPPQQNKKGY